MPVGAGIGVGDRLEIHHVLPEIGGLNARQELFRRVVRARIALVRRWGGGGRGGRAERAEDHETEQGEPRPRRSRAWTVWQGTLPLQERIAGSEALVRQPQPRRSDERQTFES